MKETTHYGNRDLRRDRSKLGEAGYSLIQTLTFLSVVSVIATIGSPRLNEVAVSYELRSASRQLYGELQRARGAAVMRNTSARVSATAGEAGLVFELYDADSDAWQAESTNNDWTSATRAITIGGLNSIEFSPAGTAANSGIIWVSAAGHSTLYIYVSPSGRIRII